MANLENQRARVRIPLSLKFRLRESFQNFTYAAESFDINAEGIGIITDAPLKPDMRIEIWPEDEDRMPLKDSAEGSYYVHGDVVWGIKSKTTLKNTFGISFKRQIDWSLPIQALTEKVAPFPQTEIPSQFVLDSMVDGVFTVDTSWRITSFNKAAENFTGVPRQNAIGQYCSDIFHSSICGKSCAIAASISSGKPDGNHCIQICNAENEQVPVAITTAPLYDNQGNMMGGVETFRDLRPSRAKHYGRCKQRPLSDMISNSPVMNRIFEILPKIAQADSDVLILGESGTGKEVLAKALHRFSDRADGPFISVNCGALPDILMASKLFGCKAGAYTDAKVDRVGRIAAAEGGTLFLDAIGEMSLAMQVELLRVLETKRYTPLGGNGSIEADIRILAAANCNLEELVQQGVFREDLFQRLNDVNLNIPALSERMLDLPLLVDYFVEKFNNERNMNIAGLDDETLSIMMQHNFPGNILELQNIIESAFVLCKGGFIFPEHLPATIVGSYAESSQVHLNRDGKPLCLEELERKAILAALKRNSWKRMKTCLELGISKDTLRRKITRYGLLGKPAGALAGE